MDVGGTSIWASVIAWTLSVRSATTGFHAEVFEE
jgi:hypothetical protein